MKKLKLYGKHGIGKRTILDDEDFLHFSVYKWRLSKDGYVSRGRGDGGKKSTFFLLHREILKAKKGEIVDHKNRNKLDNRKSNIRICSKSQNAANCLVRATSKSGVKGVKKTNGKWAAQIRVKQKNISLGTFATKKKAAVAYNKAAKKHFGEFARLNRIV